MKKVPKNGTYFFLPSSKTTRSICLRHEISHNNVHLVGEFWPRRWKKIHLGVLTGFLITEFTELSFSKFYEIVYEGVVHWLKIKSCDYVLQHINFNLHFPNLSRIFWNKEKWKSICRFPLFLSLGRLNMWLPAKETWTVS